MQRITNIEDINIYDLVPSELLQDKEFLELLSNNEKLSKALNPLYDAIPYEDNSPLAKEYVEMIEGMEWMQNVRFDLKYALKTKQKHSLTKERKYLNNLLEELKSKANIVPEYVSECGLPMIALDTETTSLITDFKIYGGTLKKDFSLVGLPLAISAEEGIYIPINHNETDGIRNLSIEAIIEFLQKLVNEFYVLYFNFNYDSAILQLHGVELNPNKYADVFHISKAIGVDTIPDIGHSIGLKAQSKYFLDRKMLEINEVVGSKGHIVFSRVSAKDSLTYACADAVNTYALFKRFVLDEDDEEYNPYMYNGAVLTLDHKALFHSISMFRHNLPLNDLQGLKENILTLINRMDLLQKTYYKIEGSSNHPIGSPEEVNFFIGSKILNNLLIEDIGEVISLNLIKQAYNRKQVTKNSNKIKNYIDMVSEDFGVICSVLENKTRGEHLKFVTRKTGWGKSAKGVPVLEYVKKNINNEYWVKILPEKLRQEIYYITDVVDNYRGLILEVQRLGKMYRYAVADDRGYATASIDLQFSGADTRRYTNSKGKGGDRLIFTGANLNLISYYGGNGLCGINAQGLPSTPYSFIKKSETDTGDLKRIVSIGDDKLYKWFISKRNKLVEIFHYNLKTKFNQRK